MTKHTHRLLIQVSPEIFSFIIKEIESDKICSFASETLSNNTPLEEQLDKFFQHHNQLVEKYSETLVLHDNSFNTFVPKAYFNEEDAGAYLQYNTKVFSTDFFAFDEMPQFEMNNVYVPYVNINNYLIDKFGSFTYQNINTGLVNHILQKSNKNTETVVFVHVQKKHFEIIVVNSGKLILFNSFEYLTEQDFIYYILFVLEQLNLDREKIKLYLLGQIEKNDALFEQAYTFINYLDLVDKNTFNLENTTLHSRTINQHYILLHS
ncbi:DUF3822 family protein [Myroides indicus]|uniref:Uncharacterized protein DUF3822 n=1 Tax=Myroides indicus TaxID=1323422 RepID=A0A4R7EUF8_9FLAO|nr:DUF3822 family protein [Myroides indicus]TDS57568.1 uncharacterized protein DUF3822 [Myroides indicus]